MKSIVRIKSLSVVLAAFLFSGKLCASQIDNLGTPELETAANNSPIIPEEASASFDSMPLEVVIQVTNANRGLKFQEYRALSSMSRKTRTSIEPLWTTLNTIGSKCVQRGIWALSADEIKVANQYHIPLRPIKLKGNSADDVVYNLQKDLVESTLIFINGESVANTHFLSRSEQHGLSQLRCLRLTKSFITPLLSFPICVAQLKGLTKLDISGHQLVSLPEILGQLTNLTSLDVSDNCLPALPSCVTQLAHLAYLTANKNRLESLIDNLKEMVSLSVLCLADNRLKSISESCSQLPKLEKIVLTNNPLTSLSSSFNRENLTVVGFEGSYSDPD